MHLHAWALRGCEHQQPLLVLGQALTTG